LSSIFGIFPRREKSVPDEIQVAVVVGRNPLAVPPILFIPKHFPHQLDVDSARCLFIDINSLGRADLDTSPEFRRIGRAPNFPDAMKQAKQHGLA
jgi:hypothetical protein